MAGSSPSSFDKKSVRLNSDLPEYADIVVPVSATSDVLGYYGKNINTGIAGKTFLSACIVGGGAANGYCIVNSDCSEVNVWTASSQPITVRVLYRN